MGVGLNVGKARGVYGGVVDARVAFRIDIHPDFRGPLLDGGEITLNEVYTHTLAEEP